jgi:glyoxylase-like metal-dependent hydrolase (beta-lactamase superfamily II)
VKMVLRILIVLLLLPVILAFVVLVPAHSQIDSIEPRLPEIAAIEAALNVEGGPVSVAYINSATQTGPGGGLGHPGVVLTWPSGKRFLIDTGMRPDEAIAFGKPIELVMGADPTVPHGSIATQLGDVVTSIEGIAFTHLHSDHTDGLAEICASQQQPATVFQRPLQYREQNHTTTPGLEHLESATCKREELAESGIARLPGFPGLIAISLGGHTPGSTLYVARVGENYWYFSGDITNDKVSLVENIPKHWAYSTLIVPENTARTTRLRTWLGGVNARADAIVLPAHDVAEMAAHIPSYSELSF